MTRAKPLVIDLFCGLGGFSEGFLAEGYNCVGFDIERHVYGEHRYPGHLVIQDVLTLHGSQFRNAAAIVASPPCQKYSWMAMPWTRAKAKAAEIRADETGQMLVDLNRLFDACFRIQREAIEAAGHHIPLIVENVRGAIPWVGRSRWSFGSFYIWGDVPALMPSPVKASKVPGFRFDGSGRSLKTASVEETGFKSQGMNWSDRTKDRAGLHAYCGTTGMEGQKVASQSGRRTDVGNGARFTSRDCGVEVAEGRKGAGAGAGAEWFDQNLCQLSSKSDSRKAASAMIAKIPFPLSQHIARTFYPHSKPPESSASQ